ncbi:DMT family transporter [Nostoc sp. PCC 7120 = FACHB-418]|uniref:DMT family transporter n=1 Tax=Nostoc sp. (strain PCC 7120 / SAG 25.82 / UTEX 2576) TaxID=103690 RepID=UPI00234FE7DA|nr:DMT family transporter [Nostoc sp. PCC 7120 = FACHB-418]
MTYFLLLLGWAFLGGLLGAIFVTLSTLIVPKLGLTTTTLVVVFSQMFMSLVIDQLGWFCAIKYPITTTKDIRNSHISSSNRN